MLLPLLAIFLLNTAYANAVPMFGNNIEFAEENEFPFIVSLSWKRRIIEKESSHECNGVLITPRHILTAAHCLGDGNLSLLKIIAGSTDLKSSRSKILIAESEITYTKWAKNRNIRASRCSDIAILKLNQDVTHLVHTKFSHLTNEEILQGRVTLAGWGTMDEVKPRKMRKLSLKIMKNRDCENKMTKLLNKSFGLYDALMCLDAEPWAVAGKGDSGAPILDENKDIVGLAISTCPMSISNFQDKVTIGLRTNHYAEFINDVIIGNEL
ncbi:hypothetical protein QAD02_009772 [Eretmocerus hayati]|uniref:Uncharacterized protein n=1 Tax=Eretmocerus hayati TaxID=131215 RepID=A0ACC2NA94_9HYME|nr:hypothetical protein QAD02_009772 [Eretmocerus hayati]